MGRARKVSVVDLERLDFPTGFIWGVATAAHQIEGANFNNDWWAWEHNPDSGVAEPSGDACDSFHRWREDIDLVASFNLGAYRFSVEWSRIEPEEGEFSLAALEHYRRMCAACLGRGLQPVVTFHHFTLPNWLSNRGGWEAADAPGCFARFVTRCANYFGDLIAVACTINEPNVIGVMGYNVGTFPPGIKGDLSRHLGVNKALIHAHHLAADALRSSPGKFPIGLTLSMAEMVNDTPDDADAEMIRTGAQEILEDEFLRAAKDDDFLGVQCYTRMHFGPLGQVSDDPSVPKTQMGYENWPRALEYAVRRAANASGISIIVTENGIATENDSERVIYLSEALRGLHNCIEDGIDVKGYFVWSLLDNFEWNEGYRPKFGLCSLDRRTFERRPKPSSLWLSQVANANSLLRSRP